MPAGRKKIELDWKQFDQLCKIQCTLTEIAAFFDCSEDTVERRVEEVHGVKFAEYFRQKKGKGKISLRRRQMQAALDGNTTMLVWLGKQYLGQADKQEVEHQEQEIKLEVNLHESRSE